jgi:hypothetical protein
MGIVSILQENQRKHLKRLNDLRDADRAVTLFEEINNKPEPRPEDIYRLVNFLAVLRLRAASVDCPSCCTMSKVNKGKQRMAIATKKLHYDRITTTIEREWLAQIIAGTKKIEYRQIKPYWTMRFQKVSLPFELRLLNGMNPPVPEVTVLIHRITKDRRAGEYRLHIKRVLNYKHWDKRRQRPKR